MSARTTGLRLLLAASLALGVAGCDEGDPDAGVDAASIDAGSPGFVGVMNCDTDADCDDGRDCTEDRCVERDGEGEVCSWVIVEGSCLIDGQCWDQGDSRPGETCAMCNASSPRTWSGEGMVCDDGDACTFGTMCGGGFCDGTPIDCDDGIACTADSCDPDTGCANDPIPEGLSCDDGDACTVGDACSGGECSGERIDCDDGDPCTDDACDGAGGCTHTNNTAACDDGDPCTVDEVCSEGSCGGGVTNACDDANACTIDLCHPVAGCYHLPTRSPCCVGTTSICDDSDPCTTDNCDPDTAACSYELNTASCDDGNACTVGDVCDAGSCGGAPLDCDDGNDCTADDCNVSLGCFYADLDATSCDDGLSCSTGDMCVSGVCEADVSACGCTPVFDDSAKTTAIAIGADETAGNALDVDGDGTLDNALAPIGSVVNEAIGMAVTDGDLMMLLEFQDFMPGAFTLALITGDLDPANASCDYQAATCDYWAERGALLPVTCDRVVSVPATRTGTLVQAGSPSTVIPLSVPLDATTTLDLTVYMATVQLTVTLSGGEVVGFSGILAGAVRETELNTAIRALDPDSLPLPPDELVSLLMTLAPNDIDTNGDGTLDAKSIGLLLDGIDGNLSGAEPL